MTPFDIKKGIEQKTGLVWDDETKKAYTPFVVNRAFSFNPASLFCAQAMNEYPNIPAEHQFDFLNAVVPKGKRFDKWEKADKVAEDQTIIAEAYDVSLREAQSMMEILTVEQIQTIKAKMKKGGSYGR